MPGRLKWRGQQTGIILAMSILTLVLSLFFLSYFAFGQGSEDVPTSLRLVSVVFRHGDRTPTETYPKDPYRNESYWKEGWGSLTKLGKQQMYSFGKALRQRYSTFLSGEYSPDEVYMVSSDHDRCLMSAELCLAGLYPPVDDEIWNSELRWHPIPVHTVPKHLDQLIVMRKPCPEFDRALNETYNSESIRKINSENADLYKYLSENSGANINSILSVESLYNTLEIEARRKLKLPDWTKGVYPEKMEHYAALSLQLFTYTDKQKRLKGGPLVGDIARHTSQKVLNTLKPDRKLFLYSGHDLNLVSTLRVLGFSQELKPENGAAIIFELHKGEDGDHYIELLYIKSAEDTVPQVLTMPKCGDKCPFRTFLELTKPFIPDNWDKECRSS